MTACGSDGGAYSQDRHEGVQSTCARSPWLSAGHQEQQPAPGVLGMCLALFQTLYVYTRFNLTRA